MYRFNGDTQANTTDMRTLTLAVGMACEALFLVWKPFSAVPSDEAFMSDYPKWLNWQGNLCGRLKRLRVLNRNIAHPVELIWWIQREEKSLKRVYIVGYDVIKIATFNKRGSRDTASVTR